MRWKGGRRSQNVEDRRASGSSIGSMGGAGIIRFLPMMFRLLGVKVTLLLGGGVLAYGLFTGNLGGVLSLFGLSEGQQSVPANQPVAQSEAEKELVDFVSVVLADTEETGAPFSNRKAKPIESQSWFYLGALFNPHVGLQVRPWGLSIAPAISRFILT